MNSFSFSGKKMQAVLRRLRKGPATSLDLKRIQWRFAVSIEKLRFLGYDIKSEVLKGHIWLYTLLSEPANG